MNLFVKKFGLFLLPIVLLAYPLDYLISYIQKKMPKAPYEKEVWNYIYENKEIPEIAIYGSSKAWVQISPAIIEDSLKRSVYNYGFDGQTFWLEYLRHLEIEKQKKSSKYILLLLDMGSLWPNESLYNHTEFLPYMLNNENMKKYLLPFRYYDALDFEIPLKRYTFQNIDCDFDISKNVNPRIKGFAANDKTWNDDFENATSNYKKIKIPINKDHLELLTQFIKENNKKVILVTTPDFIAGQHFVINYKEIIMLYQKIAETYDVPYLNYCNDSMIYDKNLYYNATHLNKKGSEMISKKIAHDLKKLLKVVINHNDTNLMSNVYPPITFK